MREVNASSGEVVRPIRAAVYGMVAAAALAGAAPASANGDYIAPVKDQVCHSGDDVTFRLRGTRTAEVGVANRYTLKVQKCDDKADDPVTVVIRRPYVDTKTLTFEEQNHSTQFGVVPPSNFNKVVSRHDNRTIVARAYDENGARIGAAKWIIGYKRRDFNKIPPWVNRLADERCSPNPNFKVGFQDDRRVVFEVGGPREEAFQKASDLYGATTVRINIIQGQYRLYGMKPYSDAIDTARRLSFETQVVLMQDPLYFSHLGSSLSYKHYNPPAMKDFAYDVASQLGSRVNLYSIRNEVNRVPLFASKISFNGYNAEYLAGREGVKIANPSARVLAGELAPLHIKKWIANFNKLGVDGVAEHPYGDEPGHLCERVLQSKSPVYATEYGNLHTSPFQGTINRAAIERARQSGVSGMIMYQLFSDTDPLTTWNTSPNGT